MSAFKKHLRIEDIDETTVVVKFLDARITSDGETLINSICEELFWLINEEKVKNLILNLEDVEYMEDLMYGKLVALMKRVKFMQGRMLICNIKEEVLEVLTKFHLLVFLDIQEGLTREQALELFKH